MLSKSVFILALFITVNSIKIEGEAVQCDFHGCQVRECRDEYYECYDVANCKKAIDACKHDYVELANFQKEVGCLENQKTSALKSDGNAQKLIDLYLVCLRDCQKKSKPAGRQ